MKLFQHFKQQYRWLILFFASLKLIWFVEWFEIKTNWHVPYPPTCFISFVLFPKKKQSIYSIYSRSFFSWIKYPSWFLCDCCFCFFPWLPYIAFVFSISLPLSPSLSVWYSGVRMDHQLNSIKQKVWLWRLLSLSLYTTKQTNQVNHCIVKKSKKQNYIRFNSPFFFNIQKKNWMNEWRETQIFLR